MSAVAKDGGRGTSWKEDGEGLLRVQIKSSGSHPCVFICAGALELWRVKRNARKNILFSLLIAREFKLGDIKREKGELTEAEERLRRVAEERMKAAPFYRLLGFEVIRLKEGEAHIGLKVGPHLHNTSGIVHGGAISALCDAAAGVAIATIVESEQKRVITLEQKVNFISPAREGYLKAIGRVVHGGLRIWVSEAEVFDDSGKLIAKSIATDIVLDREELERKKNKN